MAPALTAVLVAALALCTACAPRQEPATAASRVVQVTERDFQISAPQSVSTGDLLLQVRNQGPDSHELLIVRQKGRLPLRTDGMTVNEESLRRVTVGVLEPSEIGVRYLRLHLRAGHYQFFCNMAGHYMAGMYGDIVVR